MHGIDERRWLAYLDGESCADIERHLPACAECSETVRRVESWRAALRQEGTRLRAAHATSDARGERMLQACLAELASSRSWTPQQARLLLRSLLEPLCGAGAARTITELTMRRAESSSWRAFVSTLSENVESICGSAAGRLVGRAGLSLVVENT